MVSRFLMVPALLLAASAGGCRAPHDSTPYRPDSVDVASYPGGECQDGSAETCPQGYVCMREKPLDPEYKIWRCQIPCRAPARQECPDGFSCWGATDGSEPYCIKE